MTLQTKERTLGQPLVVPPVQVFDLFTGLDPESGGPPITLPNYSRQITASEPHKKNRHTGRYDSGGPFYTNRTRLLHVSKIKFKSYRGDGRTFWVYSGPLFPGPLSLCYSTDFASMKPRSKDTSDLDSYGATAIAHASPVNPVDTLGRGLTETYREGIPSLPLIQTWKKRAGIAKAAGDEFLNAIFGWDPLVQEVRSFASTVRNAHDLLKQYHENAGTNVHQGFRFPVKESREEFVVLTKAKAEAGTGWSGTSFSHPGSEANVLRTLTESTDIWFKGLFTYSVPSQSDSWKSMFARGSDADHLFGTSLTPDLLWDIAPWSWAVDWFSNVGDVLTNISNFSSAGQVMRYGYLMEHKRSHVSYTMDRSSLYLGQDPDLIEVEPPYMEFVNESKVRRVASPYGFGITLDSLSPVQIAIAAALGISLL